MKQRRYLSLPKSDDTIIPHSILTFTDIYCHLLGFQREIKPFRVFGILVVRKNASFLRSPTRTSLSGTGRTTRPVQTDCPEPGSAP